jgi:hypothetical protein
MATRRGIWADDNGTMKREGKKSKDKKNSMRPIAFLLALGIWNGKLRTHPISLPFKYLTVS